MPTQTGHLTNAEMRAVAKKGGSVIQGADHYLTEDDIPSDAQLSRHDPNLAHHTREAIDNQIAMLASQRAYVDDQIRKHEESGKTGPDSPEAQATAGAALAPLEQRIRDREGAPALSPAAAFQLAPKPFDTPEVATKKRDLAAEVEDRRKKAAEDKRAKDAEAAERRRKADEERAESDEGGGAPRTYGAAPVPVPGPGGVNTTGGPASGDAARGIAPGPGAGNAPPPPPGGPPPVAGQ